MYYYSKKKRKSNFERILIILFVILFCATLFGSFGRYFWIADLFSNFTVQYFFLSIFLSVALLGKGRKTLGTVTIVLCVMQLSKLMPVWFEEDEVEISSYEEVAMMQYNVFRFNPFKEDAMEWIISQSEYADIIVLHEVTFDWLPVLEALKERFKYSKIEPRTDASGVAVFTKLPYSKLEMTKINGGTPVAILYANTSKNHVPFSVYAVHAEPPITPGNWKTRNKMLNQVTDLIKEDPSTRIVLTGDLNVTRYSYWFEKLLKTSGLKDSYEGFGIIGTWPSILPNILRIAIDHTLVSPAIGIGDKILGQSQGSDHVPIITIMQIPV